MSIYFYVSDKQTIRLSELSQGLAVRLISRRRGARDGLPAQSRAVHGARAQAAARDMLRRNSAGSIINISSVSGVLGIPSRAAYCATKHGLLGLTKSLACELGPHGIRVNAVCLGFVTTPLTEKYAAAEQIQRALAMTVPMGGTADPDDIAGAVAFLASSKSRFISGVSLPVDGAFTATKTYDPAGLSEAFVGHR